jgi:phage terminase large subunit-like protein
VAKSTVIAGQQALTVVADYSGRYSILDARNKIKELLTTYPKSYLTIETNQGGDCWQVIFKDDLAFQNVFIETVRAKIGKFARAEFVSPLYEKGLIQFQMGKNFDELHKQMFSFTKLGKLKNDDRLDAFVYAAFSIFKLEELNDTSVRNIFTR